MLHSSKSIFRQAYVRLKSKIGFKNDFFRWAVDREDLCEPEWISGPPAKVIDGQYERIIGAAFDVPVEEEISCLKGAPRLTKPSTIYKFSDVVIANSWIMNQESFEIFGWPKSEWQFSVKDHISSAALTNSFQGSRYFGHWLRDDCATALILEELFDRRISSPQPDWADARAYADAFRLPHSTTTTSAFIDEMYYCHDIGQNSHKARRFDILRKRIRTKVKASDSGRIVYIARGSSASARPFLNEEEVIKELSKRGVKIVFPEQKSTYQFLEEIMDARIIIGVEGSQFSHALYALKESHSGILVIQPRERVFTAHLDWSRVMGFDFGMVVGNKRGTGFEVPYEDIFMTLDLFK
jgi:hypothetical protein